MPEDLETVLRVYTQQAFVMDDSLKADKVIVRYLWQHFRVFDPQNRQLPLIWVGKQVAYSNTQLFFQIEVSGQSALMVENRVLMANDGSTAQINYLHFNEDGKNGGEKKQTLIFSKDNFKKSFFFQCLECIL